MSRTFGWSYPPGVTGNEPELSGDDELSDEEYIIELEEKMMALNTKLDKMTKLAESRLRLIHKLRGLYD